VFAEHGSRFSTSESPGTEQAARPPNAQKDHSGAAQVTTLDHRIGVHIGGYW